MYSWALDHENKLRTRDEGPKYTSIPDGSTVYLPGERVVLGGLQDLPNLNSVAGIVLGRARDDGRIPVRISVPGVAGVEDIWLKPVNLMPMSRATATDGDAIHEHPSPGQDALRAQLKAKEQHPSHAVVETPSQAWLARRLRESGTPSLVSIQPGRRHPTTAELLPAGSIVPGLSGSAAFAACVLPAMRKRCCANCLRLAADSTVLQPCPTCNHPSYCSEECLQEDAPLHRRQCPSLADSGSALHVLEAETLAGDLGRSGALLLAGRCLLRRHDLEAEGAESDSAQGDRDGAPLFELMQMAGSTVVDCGTTPPRGVSAADSNLAYLAEELDEDFLPPGLTTDHVAATLARIRSTQVPVLDARLSAVAIGCFPGAALLPHSCAPNSTLAFDGPRLIVRTLCDVPSGGVLSCSYTDICQPTPKRQQTLRAAYGFECACSRCLEKPELDAAMEAVANVPVADAPADVLLAARSVFKRIDTGEVDTVKALELALKALPAIRAAEEARR